MKLSVAEKEALVIIREGALRYNHEKIYYYFTVPTSCRRTGQKTISHKTLKNLRLKNIIDEQNKIISNETN